MPRVVVPVTEITPPKASLTTALAGANNDLVFTALKRGAIGNAISVTYVDPGGVTATLSVVVEGFKIVVNLGRAASAINTTATALANAVLANADSSQLVAIANAAANDGTGLVTALAETFLAGGSLQTTPPAAVNSDLTNGHYFTGNDARTVIEVLNINVAAKWVRVRFGRGTGYAFRSATPWQEESIPAAVKASHTTALAGANNDLTFTADASGPGGNDIRITYVVAGLSTPLTVSVTGTSITVNVATDGAGAATSTATAVKTALDGNASAAALIDTVNATGNDGTGVVAAFAFTNLSGGEHTTRRLGPFENGVFDQNNARDVYFDPELATDLKFRVYKIPQLT